MANLIQASGDVFSAMVHGHESPRGRRFLEEQLERTSAVIGEGSKRFMERARATFDAFNVDAVERSVRAIKGRLNSRWQDHNVRPLRTLEEFQQATLTMQRWLSANPKGRQLFQKDRCHGWRDTYVDMEPGVWGERHTDWQKVNNGLVVTDEEGNSSITVYFNAFDENGDEELSLAEQRDILESWSFENYYLALGGDDPTSPSNGSL